jgi:hypothetical protein
MNIKANPDPLPNCRPKMAGSFRAIAICALLSVSAGSGCVHFNNSTRFSGAQSIETESPYALHAWVDDRAEFEVISVLLLITRNSNSPPFPIELSASDATGTPTSLVIQRLEITYLDGTSAIAPNLPIEIPFKPSSDKDRHATYRFEGIVDCDAAFSLSVQGHYILKDGTTLPFEGDCRFDRKFELPVLPSVLILNGV